LGLSAVVSAALAIGFLAVLGLVLLVEGAALMLLGSALSFGSQASVRKLTSIITGTRQELTKADLDSVEARAAVFALIGVLLFVESLSLAAATV